jgi:phosphopantetheinyl transferase
VPLLQKHQSPSWGIWKIEESWEELLRQLDCPEAYLPVLKRYKADSRKAEWLAVRVLLKELTGSEQAIAYRNTGAPYLPDAAWHISISHTKGFAAVALSPDKPVGIDIEYHSERIHRIKSRFLCEDEFQLLGDNPSTNELLVCWSAKETVFKMLDQKTADMQTDLHILEFKPLSLDKGMIIVQESISPQSSTFRIAYLITPDFVVTYSRG